MVNIAFELRRAASAASKGFGSEAAAARAAVPPVRLRRAERRDIFWFMARGYTGTGAGGTSFFSRAELRPFSA